MGTNKKPFYKKWWLWLIAIFIVVGIIGAIGDKESAKSDNNEVNEEVIEQNDKKEDEKNNDPVLSDDDVELIESNLEEDLEDDRSFGDMFYLDEFEYDLESNKILARIDMQQDPLPDTKKEVEEWSEAWAWSIVMTNPDIDETYNVRVNLVSKADDGYIVWGRTTYDSGTKKYTFKEDDGMKLYD